MISKFQNPVQLLADLVDALDSTAWSSWQTTAKFSDQLKDARDYIDRVKASDQQP